MQVTSEGATEAVNRPSAAMDAARAFVLAFLVTAATAVDRSKFRTCAQSAFCARSRRQSQGKSTFQ